MNAASITAFLLCLGLAGCKGDERRTLLPGGIELRQGDVAFRRGCGLTSHAVLAADTGGDYSHVGIVASEGGRLLIVHAVPGEQEREGEPERVKAEPPEEFFLSTKATRGAIYRHPDADKACAAARQALSTYRRGTLFDHDYDDTDTTRMYCCELVEHAFRSAGVSLAGNVRHEYTLPGLRFSHLILPSDLARGGKLEAVATF